MIGPLDHLRGATGPLVAERGRIADHPYVRVGPGWRLPTGDRPRTPVGPPRARRPPLVFVPGLNDPLLTVADSRAFAAAMATYCRRYARRRTVYFVSRPHGLDPDLTVSDLADGYARVIDALPGPGGTEDRTDETTGTTGEADVVGLSMGGFVAAGLAAEYPDRVRRVGLALAADRLSAGGRRTVQGWIDHAERGDYRSVYLAAADLLARGGTRLALRAASRIRAALRDPVAPGDFLASARACLAYDGDGLERVDAPTLVVGGDADPFFSVAAYRRTARAVRDGRLALLRGTGHEAVVEHSRTVEGVIRRFLREESG